MASSKTGSPAVTVVATGLALAMSLSAGCEGSLGGGRPLSYDAGPVTSDDGAAAAPDLSSPADAVPDDRCTPLPAGCLCQAACDEGSGTCDNTRCPCPAIDGVSYEASVALDKTDRPADQHADLNLAMRKTREVEATRGLVDINGPTDGTQPPQLYSLFADDRVPEIVQNHQVDAWDWGCNCSRGFIEQPEVTLIEARTTPGETIHTPISGYGIGQGHMALVLYAAPDTITIKYTREDNVVLGYTIHLGGICIEPRLLALYAKCDAEGRGELPAVRARQPLGRARGDSIRITIRDSGAWMDPRARKDWWQGR